MNDRVTKKVVVDAGHGGSDPGASGNNVVEKEYNLKIANYIYDRLKELGIPTYITRSTDETITPTDRVNRILNAFGNSNDVIVLSNHLNAGGGTGAEAVYALRNNDALSKLILEEIAKTGQPIRKWYQRRLPSDPSKDYYFIHRLTGKTEPVLIEYGFVDNIKDANFIKNNWQNLAEATVRAVASYVGAPYDQVSESSIYVVKRGDSLYSIAKKFGIDVNNLKSANNLQNNLISIGQKLIIPGFVESTGTNINYVVQKGDSLYSIASKYNTTVDSIKRLNNLSSNVLNVGQTLKIPAKKEFEAEVDIAAPTNTYVVEYGDTLDSIAKKNNIPVQQLIDLNKLTDYELYVGQILKLPTLAGEEIIGENDYVVKKGDNLYSIARKYNTTVSEIKKINNLTSNNLEIGQVLKMPTSLVEVEVVTEPNTYIVKKGDSLYSIALSNNTTVDEIKRLNNLTSNTLNIGDKLKLPSTTSDITTYTVKRGDSLYSIAREYNTTINEIKKLNNLTNNLLSIGQIIKIPV